MSKLTFCVAEKPSVAKAIAEILSGGKFNKVSAVTTLVYGQLEIQPNLRVQLHRQQTKHDLPSHIRPWSLNGRRVSRAVQGLDNHSYARPLPHSFTEDAHS